MSIREDTSRVLDARFLIQDGLDPLSGFPMLAPDGSLAAPSYAFEINSGSGISLVSDNMVVGTAGSGSIVVGMDGNVALGGGIPTNYGVTTPGEGVALIHAATTTPTSNPTSGGILHVSGNTLNFTNSAGTIPLTSKTGDVTVSLPTTLNSVATFNGVSGKVVEPSMLLATSSSTLQGTVGTAADNTYAFTGDPDTGMFYSGDQVKMSAGGSSRMRVSDKVSFGSTTQTLPPAGSVGAPAYSFTTSTSTGMYAVGNDMHVSVGGVNSLSVDDTGGAVPNLSLTSTPSDYGATTPGVGVVFIPDAVVDPSGVPNAGSGAVLYVSGDSLFVLNADGASHDLTKCIEEVSGSTTVNGVVRYDGATGRLVQNTSTLTVDSSGQWAGPAGSAAGVTYGFTGDADSGVFRSGAGVVDLATNSTSRLSVSSTTSSMLVETAIPDGTVAAPGLAFTSSTSSGMYLGASSSVAVSAGGTSAVSWFSGRNTLLCGDPSDSFGGGVGGVVWLRAASTVPTSNPSGGGLLYTSGTELLYRTPSGKTFTMTDTVTGPGSATDEAFALFNGTTGMIIQNGLVTGTDAGQVRSGDGLVSAPAYSFGSDTDVGAYISGTDVYLTSSGGVGGVGQLKVDGSAVTTATQCSVPIGSVSAPGLIFTGDTNTGMFSGLANQLSFGVGGTHGVSVLGSGGTNSNVSLTGGMNFGGGEGVVYLEEVGVVPVGALTSGGILYVSGPNLVHHNDAGTTRNLNSSPTSYMSGPTSSALSQVAFWDSTDGQSFDAASSVTSTATQTTADQFQSTSTTTITDSSNRLHFTADSTSALLIGTGGVECVAPLHADASLRIDGASGSTESVSGSEHTLNNTNAAGTFEWQRNGSTIFTLDASRNLVTSNSLTFPSGTETLTIGNTAATTYTIASTSSGTTDDIRFEYSGGASMDFTDADATLGDALVITGEFDSPSGKMITVADGSIAAPSLSFVSSLGTGMSFDAGNNSITLSGGGDLGFACTSGPVSGVNMALAVASVPTGYNGGDGVIYIGEVITAPDANLADHSLLYVSANDDLRLVQDYADDSVNSSLNALARRAHITLSAHTVSDATSDNLDGNVWTADADSAGVSGTTTGALSIPTTDTTVMVVAEATWVSNATGYRRVSITTGVGHTLEATTTSTAVSGTTTVQTVTLVRRIESGEANLQFAAQVYQNSGGNLDVDVVMSIVRLN